MYIVLKTWTVWNLLRLWKTSANTSALHLPKKCFESQNQRRNNLKVRRTLSKPDLPHLLVEEIMPVVSNKTRTKIQSYIYNPMLCQLLPLRKSHLFNLPKSQKNGLNVLQKLTGFSLLSTSLPWQKQY